MDAANGGGEGMGMMGMMGEFGESMLAGQAMTPAAFGNNAHYDPTIPADLSIGGTAMSPLAPSGV